MASLAERRDQILDLLNEKKYLSVEEAVEKLDSSPATIRRDFIALENEGRAIKFHGGIKKIQDMFVERSLDSRLITDIEEKKKIAAYAAALIEDEDVLFLDGSSIIYQMIQFIPTHNIKIFTHAYFMIPEFEKYGFVPYLIGGSIHRGGWCCGFDTIMKINSISFTRAFLGVPGINENGYIVDSELDDADIKKLVLNNSRQTYFVATKEKFNNESHFKIANIADTQLITPFDPEIQKQFPNCLFC